MILYHGATRERTVWDLSSIGSGNDQHGPGLYFTDDEADARTYCVGGYIHTCEVDVSKALGFGAKIHRNIIRRILRAAPDLTDKLTDWGENTTQAFEQAYKSMVGGTDYYDCLQQLWYDFYRDAAEEWAKQVVKHTKHTCYFVDPTTIGGTQHVVVFDPTIIKTLDAQFYNGE